MSELAHDYYQERADRYGIETIPDVLHGEPAKLIGDNQFISLHNADIAWNSIPVSDLKWQMRAVSKFVMGCTVDDEAYPRYPYGVAAHNTDNIAHTFVPRLLKPKQLHTGKLTAVSVEAVTASELPETSLERLRKSKYVPVVRDGNPENTEAYLALSANLSTGSRHTQVGALLMARAVYNPKWKSRPEMVTSVQYTATPLRTTELVGKQLRNEIRTVSQVVEGHNVAHPITNAVGTSRDQHGR